MRGVAKARQADDGGDLFVRIGLFLAEQRLEPDPANYALAHAVLSGSNPALATEVMRLTDGGFRLSGADVARLGGAAGAAAARPRERRQANPAEEAAVALAAQSEAQMLGFAGMVRDMRHETLDFGRDLARSVAAMEPRSAGLAEVAQLTSTMIRRVRESEERLARATDEAERLRDKLADARATARQDPLTGLANRLALAEGFAECAASGPHCLAVIDIDKFKDINDGHGHVVGDRVLCAIADTLAATCDGHLVARHGGEEFAVLMRDTAIADATDLIDTARIAVGLKRFRNRDTDATIGTVTFSAGVTALRRDESAEDAFERADRLLYAAKSGGRDRTCAE